MPNRLLIIEDEPAIRAAFKDTLSTHGDYDVDEAANGEEGVSVIKNHEYGAVICDIKMPKMDGIETLKHIRKEYPHIPVIMLSGHGELDTAVETMRLGAYDYISKPPDLNRLLTTIKNALDKGQLVKENQNLKKKVSKKYTIIGKSKSIENLKSIIEKVAPTDARVLITGPNGSGKELVAHWLHEKSPRYGKPLIEVNCAAIPSELIESELFGHEKGAFTSAVKQKKGKFELAQGGTIFLDEIGDMSLSAQAKVLRALQENKISMVGSEKSIKIDVRVVAATNKDLQKEIKENRFREDLYHRLAVIKMEVPPLAQRADDIPLLVEHFLNTLSGEQGRSQLTIQDDALRALQNKPWTGNIRELRNVIERLTILCNNTITKEDIDNFV